MFEKNKQKLVLSYLDYAFNRKEREAIDLFDFIKTQSSQSFELILTLRTLRFSTAFK